MSYPETETAIFVGRALKLARFQLCAAGRRRSILMTDAPRTFFRCSLTLEAPFSVEIIFQCLLLLSEVIEKWLI